MASASAASIHGRIYDFATSALINIFAFPYAAVCELYCGGGGGGALNHTSNSNNSNSNSNINSNNRIRNCHWDHLQIGHYIGIGICTPPPEEEEEGKQQGDEDHRFTYSAHFCQANPSTDDLESLLQDKGIPVDLVCCLHHLQLCFETEDKARTLLHNVSSLLKPGGYFFGILPDSSTIWTKYQKNVEASLHKGGGTKSNTLPNYIRSENYVITFEVEEDKFPSFGKRYQLKFANEVTFEAHCLVHFPSLIRLAREAGLEYIELQNLTEFYDDNRVQFVGMLSNYGPNLVDPRGKLLPRSFDILGLYSIFVFQKPDPDAAPPLVTPPLMADEDPSYDEEWMGEGCMQRGIDEEIRSQMETNMVTTTSTGATAITDVGEQDKGILGPGPCRPP